jgi:hypothetical protein
MKKKEKTKTEGDPNTPTKINPQNPETITPQQGHSCLCPG